jgi:ribonuclease H2 subunit B
MSTSALLLTAQQLLIYLCSFTELDAYLRSIEPLAAPVTNMAKKPKAKVKAGGGDEKEEKGKKRKNAKGSVGVENLKKANVTGMSKLSNYFKKA